MTGTATRSSTSSVCRRRATGTSRCDLNAGDYPGGDQDSDTFGDPVGDFLLDNERLNGDFVPEATEPDDDLKEDATAEFGIRADYVLPSNDLTVDDGYVYGYPPV